MLTMLSGFAAHEREVRLRFEATPMQRNAVRAMAGYGQPLEGIADPTVSRRYCSDCSCSRRCHRFLSLPFARACSSDSRSLPFKKPAAK